MKRRFKNQKQASMVLGYRSGLEEKISEQLKELHIDFSYESEKIYYVQPEKKRSYKPDFIKKKTNGEKLYIETKGRLTAADRKKHEWVKAQNPNLDIRFVFTANPEDYTNRGSIVTPLKDRIGSQIITHYPGSIEIGKKITSQEALISAEQESRVNVYELIRDLIEQIAFEARGSEYVDAKSGVSARLTISALENIIAAAERRSIINQEPQTFVRITDFVGVVPAITGKVELVYEGEQEGPAIVAKNLIGKAIRTQFTNWFPNPEKFRKQKDSNPYKDVIAWFNEGHVVDILTDLSQKDYSARLNAVPGLRKLVLDLHKDADESTQLFLMELVLHGLAEFSLIGKNILASGLQFKDLISGMFTPPSAQDLSFEDDSDELDEEDEEEEDK